MARPCIDDHEPSPADCKLCWLVENRPENCLPQWLDKEGRVKRRAALAKPVVPLGVPP
jgi:hypothetical protein